MSFLPVIVPRMQQAVLAHPMVANNPRLSGLLSHPAGPFTIHFWAPSFKWAISIANIADINRPVEKLSVPQQCAVALTGLIWSRYSTQIIPVNYNLLAVNVFMAATGLYQLARIAKHRTSGGAPAAAPPAAAPPAENKTAPSVPAGALDPK